MVTDRRIKDTFRHRGTDNASLDHHVLDICDSYSVTYLMGTSRDVTLKIEVPCWLGTQFQVEGNEHES